MNNTLNKEIEWKKNEKSNTYTCKGYNSVKSSNSKYKVNYSWWNLWGDEVKDFEEFDTLEDAEKFSSLFPKTEKVELYEVFYRTKNAGIKI